MILDLNLHISIAYNYFVRENNLKIKKKTKFKKKKERDITARLNNKDGHFLDEYERQNQEIRERLKEKLI